MIEFCDDGTIYLGETDEGGRPHGYGIRICMAGTVFLGYHWDGLSDGYGHYVFTDMFDSMNSIGYY